MVNKDARWENENTLQARRTSSSTSISGASSNERSFNASPTSEGYIKTRQLAANAKEWLESQSNERTRAVVGVGGVAGALSKSDEREENTREGEGELVDIEQANAGFKRFCVGVSTATREGECTRNRYKRGK